ncbi:MAG: hypothetical protein EPO28_08885 [Saprospiraceae bacterium]|nr:MAG: hypothetical protein EPO28_08885 [Saprospiraceae bacterium]
MKTINYGIFAEDEANKIFIKTAVPQLVSHFGYDGKIAFNLPSDFTSMATAKSGDYVFENFIMFISNGIKYFQLDLCLVGLDADDNDHSVKYSNMHKELVASNLNDRGLIFIPVQAIEYWLWYLKAKNENPQLAKTPAIESNSRQELKKWIYNRKKPTNKKSNPMVASLSQNIDFAWLNAHSASFKHFYDLFHNYLSSNFANP